MIAPLRFSGPDACTSIVAPFSVREALASTVGKMEQAIRDALDRWEPRVIVQTVEFDLDYVGEGRLVIDIGYHVRATNNMRNLVYPFYVIPAEELE